MNTDDPNKKIVSLHLPFSTIAAILATLLFVQILKDISPLLMPLFIGILLAVALHPLLNKMEAVHIPRWLSILIITIGLSTFLIGLVAALIPRMLDEFTAFLQNLPQMRQDLLSHVSPSSPLRSIIEHNLTRKAILPSNNDLGQFTEVGTKAFGGLTELLLVLVISIYLVIDGPRVLRWLEAFFSPEKQIKIRQTCREISEIVFAYASGQFITSVLSFLFTFTALSALEVPGALFLAVLAGIFDVLPVLGFFLAVFPAMLFALRVSTETSLYVLLLYLLYHALENYLIAPLVYGNRLRLSGFTVLMATLAAGFLAGIEGAISILPIVASYPVIEKIWLRRYVGQEAIEEHKALDPKEKAVKSPTAF